MSDQELIIIGASARAACFSAQRSSFSPYWIDQFGDVDLLDNFPGERLDAKKYPDGILQLIDKSPETPFIYTGAMENHLHVLEELQSVRPLLGNSAAICRAVRNPHRLAACFKQAGISHPQLLSTPDLKAEVLVDCLIKPMQSAGGTGIRRYRRDGNEPEKQDYLQEFIEGESRAGVFIGDGNRACLLGVTRQLVGEAFLHAGEFSYCGSIGPLQLDEQENEKWMRIGNALTTEFELVGLFGVDAICRDRVIYPVEVNPRYTASVEVLEHALQLPLIALHCVACHGNLPTTIVSDVNSMMAKAYLFAGQDLRSPGKIGNIDVPGEAFSCTADIPHGNTLISRGQPVMTVLASADSPENAIRALKSRAKLLYSQFDVV